MDCFCLESTYLLSSTRRERNHYADHLLASSVSSAELWMEKQWVWGVSSCLLLLSHLPRLEKAAASFMSSGSMRKWTFSSFCFAQRYSKIYYFFPLLLDYTNCMKTVWLLHLQPFLFIMWTCICSPLCCHFSSAAAVRSSAGLKTRRCGVCLTAALLLVHELQWSEGFSYRWGEKCCRRLCWLILFCAEKQCFLGE